MSDGQNWFVTDLHGTKVTPAVDITPEDIDEEETGTDEPEDGAFIDNKIYQIANEEFAQFSEYYWTTVPQNTTAMSKMSRYSGNKIHSYGLNVTFRVRWVKARGDTSGRPIPHYDLIVQVKFHAYK